MLRITALNHFNVVTNDLETSARFYERLGLVRGPRPDFGNTGVWMYIGPDPKVHLNLESEMPHDTVHGIGVVNHLGFDAHGSMDQVLDELANLKIDYSVWPDEVPGWYRAVYFSGPSGEKIELVLKDCYVDGAATQGRVAATDLGETRITPHQVLEAINDARVFTCPPNTGEIVERGIDQIIAADTILLHIQERLLDAYGSQPQSAAF
jgi:catechol 2,3-dioxygenase-like lactoylglutathione lyase family enzyme